LIDIFWKSRLNNTIFFQIHNILSFDLPGLAIFLKIEMSVYHLFSNAWFALFSATLGRSVIILHFLFELFDFVHIINLIDKHAFWFRIFAPIIYLYRTKIITFILFFIHGLRKQAFSFGWFHEGTFFFVPRMKYSISWKVVVHQVWCKVCFFGNLFRLNIKIDTCCLFISFFSWAIFDCTTGEKLSIFIFTKHWLRG